jgi:predicted N-acetyltransferase YhbS
MRVEMGGLMVEIKSFKGDFKEVQHLINGAWSEEYRLKHNQPVMEYSSVDFLRWNLSRPNSDPDLILAAYAGSKLVSFGAAMPLNLKFNDQVLRGAVISFLATHVDYQGQGIAKNLMREGLRRGVEKGYDLGYIITDAGHKAINLVKSISEDLKLKYMQFCKFTFLAKPLDKYKIFQLANLPLYQRLFLPIIAAKPKQTCLKACQFDVIGDALVVLQMIRNSCPADTLSIDWSENDLSCHLKSKLSDTYFFNFENKKAFINYFNINVLSAKYADVAHKMTMIDSVYFENMSFFEKRKFVSDFCALEKQNGSCTIFIPTLPIFDLKPFYFNLFFPSGRHHFISGLDLKNRFQNPIDIGNLLIR